MGTLGLLYHPDRPEALALIEQVERFGRDRRLNIWKGSSDEEPALQQVAPRLDMLITLGGDGTIVRAMRCVASHGVPVLGVNLGRLGFLAEVEPAALQPALPSLADGRYFVEERMMLHTELHREGEVLLSAEAINDVVMSRGRISRTVRISVDVDDHHVFTPTCDGIIVATPTGSTAYNLAAGGPIVAPDLRCMTMTPVAAHLGIVPALVIPAQRELRLRLLKGPESMVTVDGQLDVALRPGDTLSSTASQNVARFVRLSENGYFYETVLHRLGWADRS